MIDVGVTGLLVAVPVVDDDLIRFVGLAVVHVLVMFLEVQSFIVQKPEQTL